MINTCSQEQKRKTLFSGNRGFAALFAVILVLTVMFNLVIVLTALAKREYEIGRDKINSTQAYYAAEAGLEDAVLRLKKGLTLPSSYNFNCNSVLVNVSIPDSLGGSRTVVARGNLEEKIRSVQTVYTISAQEISFYYGAQVDDGGMNMGNNSRVAGNVFSNGEVVSASNKGYIDGSIIVAGSGNQIGGLEIQGDAVAHTCKDCNIGGDLTYVAGGQVINCNASGEIKSQPGSVPKKDLPISQEQIDEWKQQAQDGEIFYENYLVDSGATYYLGPIQIGTDVMPKNLTITNNSKLVLEGTIYVTGNLEISNNSVIELSRDNYGSTSGIIVADGRIAIQNNAIVRGSGEEGSYLLVLSTNNSLDPASPALLVGNNVEGAVLYASSGLIFVSNNVLAREITGYKIKLNNNAEIRYESGLESTLFTSGSGGSWQVSSWKEIE